MREDAKRSGGDEGMGPSHPTKRYGELLTPTALDVAYQTAQSSWIYSYSGTAPSSSPAPQSQVNTQSMDYFH